MKITYETEGIDETIVRFEGLTQTIRDRIVASFDALGPELRDAVAAGAPASAAHHRDRHPGRLRKSIKYRLQQDDASISMQVGPPIFYGSEIERGVAETVVTVRRRGRTKRVKTGGLRISRKGKITRAYQKIEMRGTVYRRRFHIAAKPFLRPAFESMRDRILAGISDAVASAVQG